MSWEDVGLADRRRYLWERFALQRKLWVVGSAVMNAGNATERMLFTFQSNGEIHGRRMVEASAEHLLIHEAPVGPDTEKLSWFGSEDEMPAVLTRVGFTALDIEGVLAGLRVNRVETREVEIASVGLGGLGFAPMADRRSEVDA